MLRTYKVRAGKLIKSWYCIPPYQSEPRSFVVIFSLRHFEQRSKLAKLINTILVGVLVRLVVDIILKLLHW